MSTISVRVPDKELSIFEEYAKAKNKSLSELIREIMIEHIQDEYDKKIFDEYEDDKRQGKLKIYSHEEVWKELGV